MKRNSVGIVIYFILLIGGATLLAYLKNWNISYIFDAIFIGIVTSIFGSIAFILLLWMLKPNLKLSKKIAKSTSDEQPIYLFKILNNSFFFSLYKIEIKLFRVRKETVEGGINSRFDRLEIKKDEITFMPNKLSDPKDAFFAQILTTREQINSILRTRDEYIELKIMARHALSGFSKVFIKNYHTVASIDEGEFGHGVDFSVY